MSVILYSRKFLASTLRCYGVLFCLVRNSQEALDEKAEVSEVSQVSEVLNVKNKGKSNQLELI